MCSWLILQLKLSWQVFQKAQLSKQCCSTHTQVYKCIYNNAACITMLCIYTYTKYLGDFITWLVTYSQNYEDMVIFFLYMRKLRLVKGNKKQY